MDKQSSAESTQKIQKKKASLCSKIVLIDWGGCISKKD